MFSFNVKDNTIFPRLHNIRLSITYRNASVTWLDRACLHKTVNMVVFFVKGNENTYPKGRDHSNKCTGLSLYRKEGMYRKANAQQ